MLVLSTKPLRKLTGTDRQTDRRADRQTYVWEAAPPKTSLLFHLQSNYPLPVVSYGYVHSGLDWYNSEKMGHNTAQNNHIWLVKSSLVTVKIRVREKWQSTHDFPSTIHCALSLPCVPGISIIPQIMLSAVWMISNVLSIVKSAHHIFML